MPITDDVPLPPTFTMLSDLQSGTMEVCRADAVRAYGDARAAAERERCAKIADQDHYGEWLAAAIRAGS